MRYVKAFLFGLLFGLIGIGTLPFLLVKMIVQPLSES